MRTWRTIGHYDAETQSYSACAGALQSSPWTPDFNGRMVGLRVKYADQAATSLMTTQQFRVSCSNFRPNQIELVITGRGLATAPAFPVPAVDYSVDQLVQAGVPIAVEGRNADATAVTVSTVIEGCFEVS